MPVASVGFARAIASLEDAFLVPRLRPYGKPVMYLHGASATASEIVGSTATASIRLINEAIARAGFAVGAVTATQLWGNATSVARLTSGRDWIVDTHLAQDTPVALVGVSHGTAWAFAYAASNPSLVSAIVGILPIADVENVRDTDLGGFRSDIDTAWGITYPTALPTAGNPLLNTATLAAIPMQLWYANDDPYSTGIADFATSVGAELRDVGALGHTDAAIAAVPIPDVVAFVAANA